MDQEIIVKRINKRICEKQISITTLLLVNSEENVTSSYKNLNLKDACYMFSNQS